MRNMSLAMLVAIAIVLFSILSSADAFLAPLSSRALSPSQELLSCTTARSAPCSLTKRRPFPPEDSYSRRAPSRIALFVAKKKSASASPPPIAAPASKPKPKAAAPAPRAVSKKSSAEPVVVSNAKPVIIGSDLNSFGIGALVSGASQGALFDIECTVPGEPTPLQRHRFMRSGRIYNPSYKMQKDFLAACRPYLPASPLEGPLDAELVFLFKRPLAHYRTGKFAGQLRDDAPLWHTCRKDLDNCVKFILDALNTFAYVDDSQIVALRTLKRYTDGEPCSLVRIRRLEDIRGQQHAASASALS